MRTLIYLLSILFSTVAVATTTPPPVDTIYPCSIGTRHADNGMERKGGLDRGIFTSDQGKFAVSSTYGQGVFSVASVSPWITHLDNLQFDLSTESYGTQYYVEFCYLGPQENLQTSYNNQVSDASKDIYSVSIDIDIRNLVKNNVAYAEKARLLSKYEVTCDLRGMGQNLKPRAPGELPSGVAIESDISWSSGQLPIFNGYLNFESPINQSPATTPRFCSIRIYFTEGAKTLRNYKDILQDFQIFVDVKKGKVNGLY
ncbi:MAG: hypothetical protein V4596_02825 [Bdellovibrionota bacterium]